MLELVGVGNDVELAIEAARRLDVQLWRHLKAFNSTVWAAV